MCVRARWSVFGLLVLFSAADAQEATQAQRYVIPGHGSLSLNVPRAWMALSKPLEKPPSVVLLFRPASGGAFSVQLTSAWLAPDKLAGFTPESIRSKTQDSATKLLPEAEEKEAAMAELRGAESIGYYFSLTSRGAPSGPEDYKYMTQGTVRTGEIVTIFTILHRDPVLPEKAQALRMLAEAKHSSEPSAATTLQIRESAQGYELTVPAGRLVMTLPKGGLTRANNPFGGAANNPRYFYFVDHKAFLNLSGWFEPQQKFTSVKALWEGETREWARQGLPQPKDVSFEKVGRWDAVVYDMPVPGGSSAQIRAHWVQAGTWIEMHISITSKNTSAESRGKMVEMLKGIRVKERRVVLSAPSP